MVKYKTNCIWRKRIVYIRYIKYTNILYICMFNISDISVVVINFFPETRRVFYFVKIIITAKLQSSRTSDKVNRITCIFVERIKFSFHRRGVPFLLTDATQGSLNFKLSLVKDRTRQLGAYD